MGNPEILFEQSSLEYNEHINNYYGNICVKIDDKYYPDKNWNDYILNVLCSWTYNVINEKSGTLYFYDGPYEINFVKNGNKMFLTIDSVGEFECEVDDFLLKIKKILTIIYEDRRLVNKNQILLCLDSIDKTIHG